MKMNVNSSSSDTGGSDHGFRRYDDDDEESDYHNKQHQHEHGDQEPNPRYFDSRLSVANSESSLNGGGAPAEEQGVAGLARSSFAATRPRQDGFGSLAGRARGEDKIKATVRDFKTTVFSLQGAFVLSSFVTFVFLVIFGVVSMTTFEDCLVYEPNEPRCCSCLHYNASRLLDQEFPRTKADNNVIYSILVLINATFALVYSIVAIRRENKYQIVCSLVAMTTSVIRGICDIFLETRDFAKEHAEIRLSAIIISLCGLIVGIALAPKLFNKFGWVIFKRSAGNPSQRTAYLMYQLYRSFNWLEIQSATVLLIGIGAYLGFNNWKEIFAFATAVVLEIISARQIIHHLKRDNLRLGVGLCLISKLFVLGYCVSIVVNYFLCRDRFLDSLEGTAKFWKMDPYPDIKSVQKSYNGQSCLGPGIVHDSRVLEGFLLNIIFLSLWRISSVATLVKILQRTEGGSGLKNLFYKTIKKKKKKRNNNMSNSNNSSPNALKDNFNTTHNNGEDGGDEDDDEYYYEDDEDDRFVTNNSFGSAPSQHTLRTQSRNVSSRSKRGDNKNISSRSKRGVSGGDSKMNLSQNLTGFSDHNENRNISKREKKTTTAATTTTALAEPILPISKATQNRMSTDSIPEECEAMENDRNYSADGW